MKTLILSLCTLFFLLGCLPKQKTGTPLQKYGQHYQQHQDYKSLQKVVDLLPPTADTAYVKNLLGKPMDMGFDYRYLLDSTGEKGCVIGAVFHINEAGKVDQKWLGEICE